jgi:hypothetical protein
MLAYETPAHRKASVRLAQAACVCCTFPALVGISIFLSYAAFRVNEIVLLGFYWLLIGGSITFLGFLISLISLATSRGASNEREVHRWIVRAILCGLLSLPIAAGCVIAGAALLPGMEL